MRAVIRRNGRLVVDEMPPPTPQPGQIMARCLACGICGSDLHARHGIDQWADLAEKVGYERFGRSGQSLVFGHEFSGRVAEYGPDCRAEVASGAPVVALPILRGPRGVDTTGLSESAPRAYAEQVIAQESLMMAVPNGLDPAVA